MGAETNVVVYDVVVTIVMCLGVSSSAMLLWLNQESKRATTFNYCVYIMTVGLLIYDFFGLIFEYLNTYYPEFLAAKGVLSDVLIVLYILRAYSAVVTFIFSSILSFSIYYLVVYQIPLDIQKSSTFKHVCYALIFLSAVAYFTVAFLQKFSDNEKLLTDLVSHGGMNICSLIIKSICVCFNFVMYLLNQRRVDELYPLDLYVLKAASPPPQFIIIHTLMQRVKLYPLLQLISIFPFICYGFVNNLNWNNLNNVEKNASPKVFALFLLGEAFLWLDSFLMLLVYITVSHDAKDKIKNKINSWGWCYCCSFKNLTKAEALLSGHKSSDRLILTSETDENGGERTMSNFSVYRNSMKDDFEPFITSEHSNELGDDDEEEDYGSGNISRQISIEQAKEKVKSLHKLYNKLPDNELTDILNSNRIRSESAARVQSHDDRLSNSNIL